MELLVMYGVIRACLTLCDSRFLNLTFPPLVTIPRGDINLEVGADPVPIYCHLNPEHKYFKAGYNASHLTFYATSSVSDSPLGDNDGNRLIPSKIVNATTIQAVYDPKVQRKDQVSCKINTGDNNVRGICQQHFFVGGEFKIELI